MASPAPRVQRRVSGPVRGRVAAPRARPLRETPRSFSRPLVHGLAVRVRALPDHALLDRLLRGRAWIPVLGVLLAGIVATQVEVLKLGASMGRWIERNSTLQSRNESLRASVAALADDQRIERMAAAMGMVMPAPTSLVFLAVRPGHDASAGMARIHAPDPTQFTASLPLPPTPPAGSSALAASAPATTAAGPAAAPQASNGAASGGTTGAATSAGGAAAPANPTPPSSGSAPVVPAPASGPSSGGASPSGG